jgi:hypothetical protein
METRTRGGELMTEFRALKKHVEKGKIVWVYVMPLGKTVGFRMNRDDLICCIKSMQYKFYTWVHDGTRSKILVTKNEKGEEFLCSAYLNLPEENLNEIPEADE